MKKSKRVIRIVLQVILSIIFVMAAFAKLSGNATEAALFASVHLEHVRILIGVLELLVVLGLWFRVTRRCASVLGIAIMGGAVAISLSIGQTYGALIPATVIVLLWIVGKGHHGKKGMCECGCAACANCTGPTKMHQ